MDSTAVYIGNLRKNARIGEIKNNLYKLIHKTLKISITQNDISIINGPKRYAIVNVHNQQNVDYILDSISSYEDRRHTNFDFLLITDRGALLHVDTVKAQDEQQARTDFENAKNVRPFQKPHRYFRRAQPDYGRALSLNSKSSRSTSSIGNGQGGGRSSRQSVSTGAMHSDLDVTIEEDEPHEEEEEEEGHRAIIRTLKGPHIFREEVGEAIDRQVHMIPIGDSSTLKEEDESDDSGTQMESVANRSISPIEGDDEAESENREFDDPPGSVIDLRHISRDTLISRASSLNQKKIVTPRIHRRTESVKSARRKDFFASLDRQIGASSPGSEEHRGDMTLHVDDASTPYFRPGERIYNQDGSKEFKDFSGEHYTVKTICEHVARSICGFLNAGQDGTLLIGVDHEGIVRGIECDAHQEERYMRHLLETVKEIFPPLFNEDYSIGFSPLLEDNGRQHPHLKVIEIHIKPSSSRDVLYECKEGVFVRRKGLLTGPLRPSHIQDWVKQKHFSEINDIRKTESFLKEELDEKDQMIRRQADTIMAQKSELERQRDMMVAKTCAIL